MTEMMPSLDFTHITIIIVWIIYYGIRLVQHSKNPVFFRMPWFVLWVTAYVFGWCYILNNYSSQARLEAILFPQTDLPLIAMAKLSVYSLVYLLFFFTLRYYSPYHKAWYREFTLILSLVLSCIVMVVLWVQSSPYRMIFWMGDLLLCWNALLALALLLQVARHFRNHVMSTIEYIHLMWFVACIVFAALSLGLTTLSAVSGLSTQRIDCP